MFDRYLDFRANRDPPAALFQKDNYLGMAGPVFLFCKAKWLFYFFP